MEKVKKAIVVPGAAWEPCTANEFKIKRVNLSPDAMVWFNFVKQTILPTSHATNVEKERMMLLDATLVFNLTNTSKDEDSIPSIPFHAIFVFLDTILLGVLQVEYQNKNESLFQTHKVHMQTFLTSVCIYCALVGIKIYTKTRRGYQAQIISYALFAFGTLSSASLLSILLMRELLVIVLFIWGSIPLTLARHLLKRFVYQIIKMMVKLIWDVLDCMIAIIVFVFYNKDSAIGSNNNDNS